MTPTESRIHTGFVSLPGERRTTGEVRVPSRVDFLPDFLLVIFLKITLIFYSRERSDDPDGN